MQQRGFHKMPQRYLFREVGTGTRRVGRKCSTPTNGACLRDGGKATKNQTGLVSALAVHAPGLCPSGNFITNHLLETE